ncbi:hypothetical protein PPMP20_03295 [Paraburkholderia phymatum]|uniref:Uncharacterized protein n=1 Tax=Paraburkholderia phymatum (strain DSM 17167 / CIP 108236 / LMG 21445 / STM815) TaxID=391038 RepID=B2JWY6_PARP8|nr:hypothetical protein [Paraburkholderia phymatum]ACC75463.1 conserved hypothetical protein [Paraburkholderia phymatum STM815]
MKTSRISLIVAVLAFASPFAHASLASSAHQLKTDAKAAGKETGHAVRNGVHAIGHGAKSAGRAVADATKHGYHATRKFVTGRG